MIATTRTFSAFTTATGTVLMLALVALLVAREVRRQVGAGSPRRGWAVASFLLGGLLLVVILARFVVLTRGH